MSEKIKLVRLPNDKLYTTGDAQDWTYEYTWEDFEVAAKFPSTVQDEYCLYVRILRYFVDHPEKALEGGICKERGYTAEDVVQRITYNKNGKNLTISDFHQIPI